jgi:hypothetical protein
MDKSKNSFGFAKSMDPKPRTAMAFNFFDPITAPIPVLPAASPVSVIRQAKRTKFSPPGPMHTILISGSPSSRWIAF